MAIASRMNDVSGSRAEHVVIKMGSPMTAAAEQARTIR
jgi:hypothetical protein